VHDRWSDGLLEAGFGDPVLAELVGWPSRVRRMVEVEAALGRALTAVGLIPADAGAAITQACDPDRLDLEALAARAAVAPTPVIPLVRALSHEVDELAAAWIHHGATSQDIIDTATVLQLRDALDHLEARLLEVGDRCAQLADRHRDTVMSGRTLGQQAVPITFGLKAARWLGALDRRVEQLCWVRPRLVLVQLGGAAGTSAVYGEQGLAVAEALASELGLGTPDLPWHAERDRIVEIAGALAGVATTVTAIGGDLVGLASSEVAEVREAASAGPSSSAMPHKRNPVHAAAARAAGRLALGETQVLTMSAADHEHERAAGAWQAEWVALPSALVRTGGAVERLGAALAGLEVDARRARDNLEAAAGLTGSEALATALTPTFGRVRAQRIVGELTARAAAEGRHLREVAASSEELTQVIDDDELTRAVDPASSLQLASPLIDRALRSHDRLRAGGAR
jgi:3-carboxy-cis,cis-muconate cycloisomerase